jgi:hypothetical protein
MEGEELYVETFVDAGLDDLWASARRLATREWEVSPRRRL